MWVQKGGRVVWCGSGGPGWVEGRVGVLTSHSRSHSHSHSHNTHTKHTFTTGPSEQAIRAAIRQAIINLKLASEVSEGKEGEIIVTKKMMRFGKT